MYETGQNLKVDTQIVSPS